MKVYEFSKLLIISNLLALLLLNTDVCVFARMCFLMCTR